MSQTEGKGIFIYGNNPKNIIPITWKLSAGKMLSNESSWRAIITLKFPSDPKKSNTISGTKIKVYHPLNPQRERQVVSDILKAIDQDFIFKLRIEDDLEYPCGIFSIEDFLDYPVGGIYILEICSRDHQLVRSVKRP